jgi:hypothetical protein
MRTMPHVRVVSPAALTERLTGLLAIAPGVQNMVTRAGAVRRPTGDAAEFEVRDGETCAPGPDGGHLQRVMTSPRGAPRMAW